MGYKLESSIDKFSFIKESRAIIIRCFNNNNFDEFKTYLESIKDYIKENFCNIIKETIELGIPIVKMITESAIKNGLDPKNTTLDFDQIFKDDDNLSLYFYAYFTNKGFPIKE